jgi:hypothetical protein
MSASATAPGRTMRGTHTLCIRALLVGSLSVFAAALGSPVSAEAAPGDALATAAYGQAEVWWQRELGDRTRRQLLFQRNRGAAPRVLDVASAGSIRRHTGLALGLDLEGELAVVRESRRGLLWTRVAGAPRFRRVAGTTRGDAGPSLFRGRVAYIKAASGKRPTVRRVSLTGLGGRTIWDASDEGSFTPRQVAAGARGAVVLVTYLEGAEAASFRSHLLRDGHAPNPLTPTFRFGHEHAGGMWIEPVSPSGLRVTIVREVDDTSATSSFALPTGRRLPG